MTREVIPSQQAAAFEFDTPVRADTLGKDQIFGLADRIHQTITTSNYFSAGDDELHSAGLSGSRDNPGPREAIRTVIQRSVISEALNLFEDGEALPDKNSENYQTWKNIVDLSPKIVKIMLDAQIGVSGILDKNIGPLVRFSVAAVRNPDLMSRAIFNQGVGGTDKEVPLRALAYPVTMLEAGKALREMYAVHAAINTFTEQNGNTSPTKEETKAIEEKARKNPTEALAIDPETARRWGIPSSGPTTEVFSGAEAAVKTLNGSTDRGKVRANSDMILEASENFASTFYPDIPFQTRKLLPWKETGSDPEQPTISPFTEFALEYLAYELKESKDPKIEKLRNNIVRMGSKRDSHHDISYLYAAVHGPTFGDDLKVALGEIFDVKRPDDVTLVVSYGAWPERIFDGIRQFMTENCTKESQIKYLTNNVEQTKRMLAETRAEKEKFGQYDYAYFEELRTKEQDAAKRLAHLTTVQKVFADETAANKLANQARRQLQKVEATLKDGSLTEDKRQALQTEQVTLQESINSVPANLVKDGPLYGTIMLLLDHCENPPYYPIEPLTIKVASTEDVGEYEAVEPFQVATKKVKGKVLSTIHVIGKDADDQAIYEQTRIGDTGDEIKEIYKLTEQLVTVDIPLAGHDLRNPYALQQHIESLRHTLNRAKLASDSDHRLKGESALQVNVARIGSVLKDYELLYNGTRHHFYDEPIHTAAK